MTYSVTITKKHCEGRQYNCIGGCPLFAAIQEQLPEFPIRGVGGTYVRDADLDSWHFNSAYHTDGWNEHKMRQIESGKVQSHVVVFSCDKKEFKVKYRVITKYVSVPETINEQAKKLILS